MKKCTVGIDAQKESNVLALAFNDIRQYEEYGAELRADILHELLAGPIY